MSSIINKNKRKKAKQQFGWTNSEVKMINKDSIVKGAKNTVVLSSYKDFIITGYYILYLHNGFGLKRIRRLETALNEYLDKAREDKNMNGTAMAYLLKEKYNIDIKAEVNSIPSREILSIFGANSILKQNEVYALVSASLYNYLAMTCVILKTLFKLPAVDVKKFVSDYKDIINTISRVKQFDLRFSDIAECLANEVKFVDERYIKLND